MIASGARPSGAFTRKTTYEIHSMDLSYSSEELAFRGEVRGWLDANLPDDLRDKVTGLRFLRTSVIITVIVNLLIKLIIVEIEFDF